MQYALIIFDCVFMSAPSRVALLLLIVKLVCFVAIISIEKWIIFYMNVSGGLFII